MLRSNRRDIYWDTIGTWVPLFRSGGGFGVGRIGAVGFHWSACLELYHNGVPIIRGADLLQPLNYVQRSPCLVITRLSTTGACSRLVLHGEQKERYQSGRSHGRVRY